MTLRRYRRAKELSVWALNEKAMHEAALGHFNQQQIGRDYCDKKNKERKR